MKHKDIAIAWLKGAEIERLDHDGKWEKLHGTAEAKYMPAFADDVPHRIKPKTLKVRLYRRKGLKQTSFVVYRTDQSEEQNNQLYDPYEWISDWVEIPVNLEGV